jgi:hypothetical protein
MRKATCEPEKLDACDEINREEENNEPLARSPIALVAVSDALSRRWQMMNIKDQPRRWSEDHYLNEFLEVGSRSLNQESELTLFLLKEMSRLLSQRLKARLRASRQARRQLIYELARLARFSGREDLLAAVNGLRRVPLRVKRARQAVIADGLDRTVY